MSYIIFNYGCWSSLDREKNGSRVICKMYCNNNGKLHRLDGPAIDRSTDLYHTNDELGVWCYNGSIGKTHDKKCITSQKQFEQWLKLMAFQ